jgi:hypothetical protein
MESIDRICREHQITNECLSHYWDHRNEIEIEQYTIECKELEDIYPFVERNNSTEVLKINRFSRQLNFYVDSYQ